MLAFVRSGFESQLRLSFVLLAGRRVPWIARGAIVFAVYYIFGPINLISNDIPYVGRLDDIAVSWLSWVTAARIVGAELLGGDISPFMPVWWSTQTLNGEVWVLADDRIGNTNQSLGVAETLGLPVRIQEVRYTSMIRLPNFLRETSLVGFDAVSARQFHAPWPRLVVGTGRRVAPALRYIKLASGGRTKIIQIMSPEAGFKEFDLIVIPNHDRTFRAAPNILRTTGAPSRVTPARLKSEADKWQKAVAHLPLPRIGLLIGGDTRFLNFSTAMAAELGQLVSEAARNLEGSLLITSSRRTNGEVADVLHSNINVPAYFYRWTATGANPFFGFLGLAEYIVVTGDSMSMCSEACASGRPVYIYAPVGITSSKYERLHAELYDKCLARPFEGYLQAGWQASDVNPTDQIAAIAAELLET